MRQHLLLKGILLLLLAMKDCLSICLLICLNVWVQLLFLLLLLLPQMGPEERRIYISIVISKQIATSEVPSEIRWLELGSQIGTVQCILSKIVN